MKISTKIYGGFGLMLAIMLVIVGVFYYQYKVIEEFNYDVTNYRLPMQDKAQDMALGAAREAAASRGYLVTGNPKFKQDLEKAIQQVDMDLEYLNEHAKDKGMLKAVNDANTKFLPHLKKMVDLYDTQGQAAAAAYLTTFAAPDNAALLSEIDKYVVHQEQLINEDIARADAQAKKMVVIVAGILLVGLSIGAVSAILIVRPILASLRQGVEYAESMAQGVFNKQLTVQSTDEIGMLLQSLSSASVNLRSLIKQVASSAESVAASSEELTAGAEQSALAANQVATTIEEVAQGAELQTRAVHATAITVDQMSVTIGQVAANAKAVTSVAEKTASAAKQGDEAIDAATNQMVSIERSVSSSAQVVAKLGERSTEIGQIVDTISGIAGQTNLLALNAAIEAARAGEQGRGFAVVAEEVRKLAEQSQEAAKQIASLISEIQIETGNAVSAMDSGNREVKVGAEVVNHAGVAFKEIVSLVSEVSAQISGISASIQQMSDGSQQIVASVRDIDRISKDAAGQTQTVSAATEEQSASMEEIAASSQALARMAEELQAATRKFSI